MYSGAFNVDHCYEVTAGSGEAHFDWPIVDEMDVLGAVINRRAESRRLVEHRLFKAEAIYWKHSKAFIQKVS